VGSEGEVRRNGNRPLPRGACAPPPDVFASPHPPCPAAPAPPVSCASSPHFRDGVAPPPPSLAARTATSLAHTLPCGEQAAEPQTQPCQAPCAACVFSPDFACEFQNKLQHGVCLRCKYKLNDARQVTLNDFRMNIAKSCSYMICPINNILFTSTSSSCFFL
jgi:hypothetical protein